MQTVAASVLCPGGAVNIFLIHTYKYSYESSRSDAGTTKQNIFNGHIFYIYRLRFPSRHNFLLYSETSINGHLPIADVFFFFGEQGHFYCFSMGKPPKSRHYFNLCLKIIRIDIRMYSRYNAITIKKISNNKFTGRSVCRKEHVILFQ